MGTSKERDGFFGKYTEHFDDKGNKVSESRDREGFFGDYTEHTDSKGNKIGESKEREGFFGNYTEHKGTFHPINKQKNVGHIDPSKTGNADWSNDSIYEQTEYCSATTNSGPKDQATKRDDIDSHEKGNKKKTGIRRFIDLAINAVIASLIFLVSAIFAFVIVTASWEACGVFFNNIVYSTNPLEVIFKGIIAGTWGLCNLMLAAAGIVTPFISVSLYFSYKDYK